jgi:hypothetical protein
VGIYCRHRCVRDGDIDTDGYCYFSQVGGIRSFLDRRLRAEEWGQKTDKGVELRITA